MSLNSLSRITKLILIGLQVIWVGGCASDVLFNTEAERPVWANRAPASENGLTFFVGRSSVLNVADEQQGVYQAIDDAIIQIAKATGAKITGHTLNGVEPIAGRVQIDAGSNLIGLRQEASYCQRGYLHNDERAEFRRFQYYILASIPDTELARLENQSRNVVGKSLDYLLAEANKEVTIGALTKSRDILKSAVALYPNAPTAWTALADVQEKLLDWDGAFSAWDSLRQLALDSNTRDFAKSALIRVNDERVVVRMTSAEKKAQAGQFSEAVNMLTEAANLKPSAGVLGRLRNRYFEFIDSWFEVKIRAMMISHQWQTLAIVNFSGGSKGEGIIMRDRIYSAISSNGGAKIKILFLSEKAIISLQQGQFNMLPKNEQMVIEQAKADAILFGTIGGQIDSYLLDVSHQQTLPLLSANQLGAVPCLPNNSETWLRLPAKNSTSRGLRVEIWTDKSSYHVGSEVEFYLRSNQDCYVTLLDLQTSSGLYVLFPNSFQKINFIQANKIYTIPSPEAPFLINARGPSGVEGVKAIASIKSLSLKGLTDGSIFITARTPDLKQEIISGVLSAVKGLTDDEWDVADWTFEILN